MSIDKEAIKTHDLLLASVVQLIEQDTKQKKEIHSLKTKLGKTRMELLYGKPSYGCY